jgi:hypothetical protein
MKWIVAAALAIAGFACVSSPAANATCSVVYSPELVGGVVVLQAHEVCTPDTQTVVSVDQPPTDSGLDSICVETAITLGHDPYAYCGIPPDASPVVTPGMVAATFKVFPLPVSRVQVEPPNGRTLVNFETNFFTDARPFNATVTLLGRPVDLRIVPSAFGWHFGDGESTTTDEPGSPYPKLDVTHSYLTKGPVAPSVDTTYTATYRVNGGPWRDVPGSVTIAGAPVQLEVLTATPVLVGYDS